MTHMRTQIRNAIISKLTALAENPTSVFSGRVDFVSYTTTGAGKERDQCPFLEVDPEGEKSTLTTIMSGSRTMQRIASFGVTAGLVVGDADDLAGAQDEIAAEVETTILDGTLLGGLVNDVFLDKTAPSKGNSNVDPSGFIYLGFVVEYYTLEGDPQSSLD